MSLESSIEKGCESSQDLSSNILSKLGHPAPGAGWRGGGPRLEIRHRILRKGSF